MEEVASHRFQEGFLVLGFHAFRDGQAGHHVGHRYDGFDDEFAFGARPDFRNEGTVDLDASKREAAELGQRGVTGAEIVDRNAVSSFVQFLQMSDGERFVADQTGFRDLELKKMRRDGVASGRFVDVVQQVVPDDIQCR